MTVYIGETQDAQEFLKRCLSRHIPHPFTVERTQNGKPYVAGNPVFFSLSHSKNYCVIAVADQPVGVDLELWGRTAPTVLSRFSTREKEEIRGENDFLYHWTAREAYIKREGSTLYAELAHLEYFQNVLYRNGTPITGYLQHIPTSFGIIALCTNHLEPIYFDSP